MPEQLLDLANVGLLLKQVGRARVAQRVRRDVFPDPGALRRFAHHPQQVVVRERAPRSARDEQDRPPGFTRPPRPHFFQIEFERRYRALRQGYDPRLPPLAQFDPQAPCQEIRVVDRKPQHLLAPYPRSVEHFEHCPITDVTRLLDRRQLQQQSRFFLRQHVARQTPRDLRHLQRRGRIEGQQLLTHHPFEPGLDRRQRLRLRADRQDSAFIFRRPLTQRQLILMQMLRHRFCNALDLGLLSQPREEVSHAPVVFFPRPHRVIAGPKPFAEPTSEQFQFLFSALLHRFKKISALPFFANASRSRLKRLNKQWLIAILPFTRSPQAGHKLPSRSPFSASRFIFSPQGSWPAARLFLLAARTAFAAAPRHPPARTASAGRLRPGDRKPVHRRSVCHWPRCW